MSRQLKLLRQRNQKISAVPSSQSSSEESSEGEDSAKELFTKRQNPFLDESESDGEEEEDDEVAESSSDGEKFDFEPLLPDSDRAKRLDRPTDMSTDIDLDLQVESIPETEIKYSCWTMQEVAFDSEVEMSRIAQTQRRVHAKAKRSLVGRRHAWLCPKNELLELLESAQNGQRWVGFDPRSEQYYTMTSVTTPDGLEFNWIPTERYLSVWNTLEEIIAQGDIHMLHEFTGPTENSFHPAANLFLAEAYIQRDEFEASFKYILKALGSFQSAMQFAFSPSTLQSHRHSSMCRPPMPSVALGSLDERDIAAGLAVVADDLEVQWDVPEYDTTEAAQANRQRVKDIQAALKMPCFGNLLFVKVLHMYAWSLAQRGCPRTSLEVHRLVHAMTLGNDAAHSLLHIADLCVRSRQDDIFMRYADSLIVESLHKYSAGRTAMAVTGEAQALAFDSKTRPLVWRLDFALPHFAFGMALMVLRNLPVRVQAQKEFREVLDNLTATDFWDFVKSGVSNGMTTLDTQTFCALKGSLKTPCRDDFSGTASIKLAHLTLMRALWLFPGMPNVFLDIVETSVSTEFKAELLAMPAFNKASAGDVVGYLGETLPELDAAACRKIAGNCRKMRTSLLTAYCKQSAELWLPFIPWLRSACAALNRLAPLERTMGDVPCRQHNFRSSSDEGSCVVVNSQLRVCAQISLFLACPGFVMQYAGVRASEFDGKKPVLPDLLLNSSPEASGTSRMVERRHFGGDSASPLQQWWSEFQERTGRINPNSSAVFVFLQALLPWSCVEVSGADF